MVALYVGSFPPDPETDLKNFQRKQSEYAAAWHATSDPLALFEALLNAHGYLQLPAELNWLMTAFGDVVMRGRTDQAAERFRERMRHVQRYRCVRDLRRKGHTKACALDLAVAALETTDAAAALPTIEDSYNLVSRDLKRLGSESEYFLLVARGDPTAVPVLVTHVPGGVAINGVPIRQGGDRSTNDHP